MKKTKETTSFRFNDDDKELITALKRKTGVRANTELVRMGLRALAEKFDISAKEK